jgi:hypothetical protein
VNKKRRHKHNLTILRYLIGVITVIILILLVYLFLTVKKVPCANTISCKEAPKFEIETDATGIYNNKPVSVPNISLSKDENVSPVLGLKTTLGEKHIFVNLATQTLSAYEGSSLFIQTPISSGLWGKTPKGDFTIWSKFRATRMSGGSGADYYDLPNVPYVMFFSNNDVSSNAGFSLHGTYWHNNFGHAMSHGCVNMKTTDAAKVFEWADAPVNGNKGTKITIYGNPPV